MSAPRLATLESSPAGVVARVRLRILATTDLHGHLLPWDYDHARPDPGVGLARTARLIAAARAEEPNSLLFDNGDFLQGTALTDTDPGDTAPNPVIAAMNHLRYTAAALGNHEFSLGLPHLDRALAGARFPVLSANLVRSLGPDPLADQPFTAATAILPLVLTDRQGERHALRLGIIGFTPPQTLIWDGDRIGDALCARPVLQAARAHLPMLRARGADLVVALCHAGLGAADASGADEDIATALAAEGGIDALIAGHSHRLFPHPDHPPHPGLDAERGTAIGVPVVMPGHAGSHLGIIDLDLVRQAGRWRVAGAESRLRALAGQGGADSDPVLARLARPVHDRTLKALDRRIGRTGAHLHTHLARFADCAALHVVAAAQAAHVRARLAGGPLDRLPVLASVAPFKAGGRAGPDHVTDIPPGPLRARHLSDLYIHPNRIAALLLTGAEVAAWLEQGARQFLTVPPGAQDAELIDPETPAFAFETVPALTWQVDLSAPPGDRIRDLRLDGRLLDPSAQLVVATNSYRAGGSGGFPGTLAERDGPRRIDIGDTAMREVLATHLAAAPVPRDFTPSWRLAPMPGTTVLVTVSPPALDLAAGAALRAEDAGPAPGGFRRMRLFL